MSGVDGDQEPVPEVPFLEQVLELAKLDLKSSNELLQRVLTIEGALLTAALTVAGLFGGIAISNSSPALAWISVPILLVLAFIEASNRFHFRRVSRRIRDIEDLLHHYVVVLREHEPAVRSIALEDLESDVNHYRFGVENSLSSPKFGDTFGALFGSPRGRMMVLLACAMGVCGFFVTKGDTKSCLATDNGVVAIASVPEVKSGEATVVPCPEAD